MHTRVVRMGTGSELTQLVAERLLAYVIKLQRQQPTVHLCLTGGKTANEMYERLADLADGSELDPTKLELWWGDERFVPATDPDRHSQQAVTRLARTISIRSADTHMMAARDGRKDSQESAAEYAAELGDTRFDITLLGIGEDGHVASIFPGHPSFDATTRTVIGVEDSPKLPGDRISLTIPALNHSQEIWFMATGEAKADVVARALAGDLSLPAAHIQAEGATVWFLDEQAASALPAQHTCTF